MNVALAVDLAVNGLITGLFYALMAIGLSLIFGILRIVNFAHGEFYMVGAYAYTLIALAVGLPVWISLPVAFLVGAAFGWTTEKVELTIPALALGTVILLGGGLLSLRWFRLLP